MSTHLRDATRDDHLAAEESLAIGGDMYTLAHYISLLTSWRDFYHAWEPTAAARLSTWCSDYWAGRSKVAWLESDLHSLGATTPTRDVDVSSLRLDTDAGVIGVLYVTEGSTMGGQYIAKSVGSRFGLDETHGLRFFVGYGSATAERWRQTKALIDRANVSSAHATAAAKAAFACLAGR